MPKPIPLSELDIGETGIVSSLTAQGTIRRRLLDLGFVPGASIKSQRRSPLGEPTAYQVRGAVIALRKEESQLIKVIREG